MSETKTSSRGGRRGGRGPREDRPREDRPRDDRPRDGSRSAVESHYDAQAVLHVPRGAYMKSRSAGSLIRYKEFANSVKRRMIKVYAGRADSLVDLGCGRAGCLAFFLLAFLPPSARSSRMRSRILVEARALKPSDLTVLISVVKDMLD